jgi:DNA-binding transcriptional ArsR family regulator
MEDDPCIHILKALADKTRWEIVRELLAQPRSINELAAAIGATQYNASKHVRILREAGIVETRRAGIHVNCHIVDRFRQRLTKKETVLDLGCCTFRFDRPVKTGETCC